MMCRSSSWRWLLVCWVVRCSGFLGTTPRTKPGRTSVPLGPAVNVQALKHQTTSCRLALAPVQQQTESANPTRWDTLEKAVASTNATQIRQVLGDMKAAGQAQLWNSTFINYRRVSLPEMMMYTNMRGDILDKLGLNGRRDVDKIAVVLGVLVAVSFLGSTAIIEALPGPDIVRWVASYVVSSLPFAFLLTGLAKPALLQTAIVQTFRLNPRYRDRLLWHEAGHFLAGYLCGMPVAGYSANSVTNAVQFYPLENMALQTERGRLGLSEDDIMRLAIVSLGGIVAESIEFGNSEGGYADLMQLQSFMSVADPPLKDREQQERVRYSAIMAHTFLKNNQEAFQALLSAFRRRASVVECIQAIEAHAK